MTMMCCWYGADAPSPLLSNSGNLHTYHRTDEARQKRKIKSIDIQSLNITLSSEQKYRLIRVILGSIFVSGLANDLLAGNTIWGL